MHIATPAIVCAVLAHGEAGAVARLMTPADGLQPGYVRGGRSRRLRPVLMPGNVVQAEFRARTDAQLAALTVELVASRATLMAEPLAAAAIAWTCALTATALPEGQAYPRVHAGLEGVLAAIEAAPSARGWARALVRFELLLLAELGFGLERDALPRLAGDQPEWQELIAALAVIGERFHRDLLTDRAGGILPARERLVTRLTQFA